MISGKSIATSETSERAQSAKRDSLSSGEKDSPDSKATQVWTRLHVCLQTFQRSANPCKK